MVVTAVRGDRGGDGLRIKGDSNMASKGLQYRALPWGIKLDGGLMLLPVPVCQQRAAPEEANAGWLSVSQDGEEGKMSGVNELMYET